MHILQVNKFYHIVGGVDTYFFSLSELLMEKGNLISYFSMKDKNNEKMPDDYADYFISNINIKDNNLIYRVSNLLKILFNIEAKKKIGILLDDLKPKIVHLHSIYHYITISILQEINKRNLPLVQSLGDYHLISPNYHMFHDGKICEITYKNKYYKALFHRCVKNSYLLSLIEILEKYLNDILGWEKGYVDYFLVPSNFMKNKLIEYGISSDKVIKLPYFLDYRNYYPNYETGKYILYFGRLSKEKGLNFLLDTMKLLPRIGLIIVGCGDEERTLKFKVKNLKLKNIQFLGFKKGNELKKLITMSSFTILPSLWYETFGLSILESFACGKPVVASNIGGIPEIVRSAYNGFLFKTGNIEDCKDKITRLWKNHKLCQQLGKNARRFVEKYFGPEEHYEQLMEIYKKAKELHR